MVLKNFSTEIGKLFNGTLKLSEAFDAAKASLISFVSTPAGAFTAITIGITSAIAIYQACTTSIEEQKQKVSELTAEYESINAEIAKLNEKQATSPFDTALTENEKQRLEYLKNYQKLLEDNLKLENSALAEKEWFKSGWSQGNPFKKNYSEQLNTIRLDNSSLWLDNVASQLYAYNLGIDESQNASVIEDAANKLFKNFVEAQKIKDKGLTALGDKTLNEDVKEKIKKEIETADSIITETESYLKTIYSTGVAEIPENLAQIWQERFFDAITDGGSLKPAFDELKRQVSEFNRDDLLAVFKNNGVSDDSIYKDAANQIQELAKQYGVSVQTIIDALYGLESAQAKAFKPIYTVESTTKVLDELNDAISGVQKAYSAAQAAIEEYNEYGSISVGTLQSLITETDGYLGFLINEQGELTLTTQALKDYTAAKIEDLAITQAQKLVATIADNVDNKAKLEELAGSYKKLNASKWESIILDLKQLNLSVDLEKSFINQINALRSMATTAVGSLGKTADSLSKAKDEANKAKSAIESLLSTVMAMLKQRYTDQIESIDEQINKVKELAKTEKQALEDELDGLKRKINAQLELLRAKEAEHDYDRDIADKNKGISSIQSQLDKLQYDDSAEAQAKKLELQEQLAEQQAELEETIHDRGVELQEDALNGELDRIEELYNNKIEALEDEEAADVARLERQKERLQKAANDEYAIRQEAFNKINKGGQELYNALIEYNEKYGDGVSNTIKNAWSNAYEALNHYKIGSINVLDILERLTAQTNDFSIGVDNVSAHFDTVVEKVDTLKSHVDDLHTYVDNVTDSLSTWKSILSKCADINEKTMLLPNAAILTKAYKTLRGYSNGGVVDYTGLANVHGSSSTPEMVLNYTDVQKLYDYIHNTPSLIQKSLQAFKPLNYSSYTPAASSANVSMGDVIINGDATQDIVNQLKDWQKETVDLMFRTLNKHAR